MDEINAPNTRTSLTQTFFPILAFGGMFLVGIAFPYVSLLRELSQERGFLVDQDVTLESLRIPVEFFIHPALRESLWSASVQGIVVGKEKNLLLLRPLSVEASQEGFALRQNTESTETFEVFVDPQRTRIARSPKNSSRILVYDGEKMERETLRSPAEEISLDNVGLGDRIIGFVQFENVKTGWRAVGQTLTLLE